MGLDKVIIACDERIAAKVERLCSIDYVFFALKAHEMTELMEFIQAAGLDQRPLTRREIVRPSE